MRTLGDALGLDFTRIQFTPRSHAGGHHRHQHRQRGSRQRAAAVRVPAGPDLRPARARRRDQPCLTEVEQSSAARGDAGEVGDGGGATYLLEASVLCDGHPEPHRAGGHLSPARGPARSLPPQGDRALRPTRRDERDPRPDHGRSTVEIDPVDEGIRRSSPRRPARRIIVAPSMQDYVVRLVLATHKDGEHQPEGSPE